ncbi:angiopoietin-1 isoform X1 [Triplophysa rosa]|uniref:angiopoietin-1 isoform X1 n=1 Tax=Triplophysa rosa TaxID=992332 RepID=UPI002545D768|nr:angiopoietin-1 isoform X1 [Triplophysa rosa]
MRWSWFFCRCASLAALLVVADCAGGEQKRGAEEGTRSSTAKTGSNGSGRKYHRVQHGQCSYTFILPESDGSTGTSCREFKAGAQYNANALQRDSPQPETDFSNQKIQQLEHVMENYTQWLQKIENYIKESMKTEMVQLQQSAVHNHTAAMLEMGTSLLSQTAEQTRKLTDVETQVLNQTSRLEIQLLENSLSTNKLEKQLMVQINEINKIHDKNGFLELKMQELEDRHREELEALREEKSSLQVLVSRQSSVIRELEAQLSRATGNSTALQKQQQDLMETVRNLLGLCAKDGGTALVPNSTKQADEERKYRDCTELYQAGFQKNGVYTINIGPLETKRVYCNMESAGGGWTVIHRREDGTVDFQRTWKEYKMGFGSVSAEHWLGNEFVYILTNQRQYALRVELTDWDGHQAFSQYDSFHIGSEKNNYSLFLKSHSGTAGRQSSLVIHGADFSTKDMDNDNCTCKCALMLSGGWWYDACGPSNLNGVYYRQGQHVGKFNGIKWHYFKGPSYSLRATAMMIRPVDFS